jgi:lipoate-protein ligase B
MGRREYGESLQLQREIVQKRKINEIQDSLLFVEYPPTITLGRSGKTDHLLVSSSELQRLGVAFHPTERGGDITYHGPGQMIAYPVLDLKNYRRDIDWYLRRLEDCIMATLADFGIQSRRLPGATGVWVGEEKIAAIGVRTSQWVTSHGLALNVCPDLDFFRLIVPCGIASKGVTSMAKVLQGRHPTLIESKDRFCAHFSTIFQRVVRQT